MELNTSKPAVVEVEKVTPEVKLEKADILALIAEIHHSFWMRERLNAGKTVEPELRKVSEVDLHMATDVFAMLEELKNNTRQESVKMVATISHRMWLLDLKTKIVPNEHDLERAEEIISALEEKGVLSFPK